MHRYPLIAILIPLIIFILILDNVYRRDIPIYPKERTQYLVEVLGSPVKRHKTWRMPAAVLASRVADGRIQGTIRGKGMVYLMVDSGVPVPTCADRLWLDTRLVSISDSTSTLPTYYRNYLYHNDYCFTTVVYANRWSKLSEQLFLDLYYKTAIARKVAAHFQRQRNRLVTYYHSIASITSSDRLSLLESLSIGQRQHLSDTVKMNFSASGVSHLLALSGFHLMILLLPFFWWKKIDRRLGSRIVQSLLIVLVMAYFTFLSGAPVSLCRASLLLACCYILSLFNEQVSTLNNLFLVAIIMLLIRPFWLFDVGFQLSFVAVLSIQLFLPLLRIPIGGKNAEYKTPLWRKRVITYIWDPISVAMAAQIGTFPLVAYHFNQFALYGILASVIMIPIITPLLYLAWGMPLFHLAFSTLGIDHLLSHILSALLGAMLFVAQEVNKLPGASIHFQHIQWFELVLNYTVVFLIYRLLKTKKYFFYGMLLVISIFVLLILSRF